MPGDSIPTGFRSVVIETVTPELDGGRYPVKREVGQTFVVEADLFKEGHDVIAARIVYRGPGDTIWHETPLTFWDNDRWRGSFELTEVGMYTYTVEAYPDRFRSWAADTKKKADAGQDVSSDLLEGSRLIKELAELGADGERTTLLEAAETVGNVKAVKEALKLALDPVLVDLASSCVDPAIVTRYDRELQVKVDRERARFGSLVRDLPALAGHRPDAQRDVPRGRGPNPGHRGDGLRRPVHDADPPDRDDQPQGAEQHPRGRPERSRQPVRDRREDGRAHGDRAGAGHAGGLRPFRAGREAARHGAGDGLRDPGLAGPSVGHGASGVVLPPPGRHD